MIVGVWLKESRLTVYNGDLTGRIIGINADKWSKAELGEVIRAGEYLLNIRFSDPFKETLLQGCLGSVYIIQESCYQACEKRNINFVIKSVNKAQKKNLLCAPFSSIMQGT